MISVTIAWREYKFVTSYLTLVTDMDSSSISSLQEWILKMRFQGITDTPWDLQTQLMLVASLVKHISEKWDIKGVYTNDYGEFVSIHNTFKNDKGLETIYVDFDADVGVQFQIGALNHFGPRTDVEGFMALSPDLFNRSKRRNITADAEVTQVFEDVLDILEE